MAKTWRYKTHIVVSEAHADEILELYGRAGWELVAVLPIGWGCTGSWVRSLGSGLEEALFIFKQPGPEEED